MSPHIYREPEPSIENKALKGVTPRTIVAIIGVSAAAALAWFHEENRTDQNSEAIAVLQAASSKDHDLLTRVNGNLEMLLRQQGIQPIPAPATRRQVDP